MKAPAVKNADEYIASFPEEIRQHLETVRDTIKKTGPDLEESISYGMPAYKYKGKSAVYFAGYKSHIGFYATPTGHEAFAKALSKYKQGKGSVQFPLTEPMPLKLIADIVKFRIASIEDKNTTLTQ